MLAIAMGLSAGTGNAQSVSLCGVKIPAAAGKFIRAVEDGYKQPIQCTFNTTIRARGGAIITPRGPLIIVHSLKGKNANTIVHELLHLDLSLKGFEINPQWSPPRSTPPGYSLSRALRFEALIYDELQHRLIGPVMKSMGLDINAAFAPGIRNLVRLDGVQVPPEQAIVNMLRLADNSDGDTLMIYEAWLKRSGYTAEERIGEWVIQQVRSNHFDTTDKALHFCRIADARVMESISNDERSKSYK